MPINGYFPALGFENQGIDRDEFDRWLKYRSFQQQVAIYVAASDTPENLRYMAQYKCDGIDDQETINEADAVANAGGELLVLLGGTYELSGPIQQTADILDARGARIRHDGTYTGKLWENFFTECELIGGTWGPPPSGVVTEPVIYVGNDRCHIHRVHVGTGSGVTNPNGIALYIPNAIYDTNVSECQISRLVVDGWANHIHGNRIHDFEIGPSASETYIGINNVRGTFYDFGDSTRYPPGFPLAYGRITGNVALPASEGDITGLRTKVLKATSTFTQSVRVRAHLLTSSDAANGRNKFNLKDSTGAYLDETTVTIPTVGDRVRIVLEWQGTITSDRYFLVRGFEVSGNGQVDANSAYPAWIEVTAMGNMVSGIYEGDGDLHLQYMRPSLLSAAPTFPTGTIATA